MSTTLSPYRSKKLPATTKPSATKRFFRALGILLLLLAVLAGIGYGGWAWTNHVKVKALQAQLAAAMQEGGGGRERSRELRDQVKELPESYQQDFRNGMRDMFRARQEKRMMDYLAMDKEARRQELLRQIAEGEKRRAQWEQRRAERDAQRQADLAKNGGNANGQNGSNGNGQNGSQNGGQGNGQGGRGGAGGGLAARLDNSSPQMRAAMAEYVRDMNQVRREMGLQPWKGWGGGRGRR
jgi:hypothetical protein